MREGSAHRHCTCSDTVRRLLRTGPELRSGTCRSCVFRCGWSSVSASSPGSLAPTCRQPQTGDIHRQRSPAEEHTRSCPNSALSDSTESRGLALARRRLVLITQNILFLDGMSLFTSACFHFIRYLTERDESGWVRTFSSGFYVVTWLTSRYVAEP